MAKIKPKSQKPKEKQKPKLYAGQSEYYLFYKIEDQKGRLVEKKKFKLTDENKNRFWYEAASRILPTLEDLVNISEKESYKRGEIYSQYVDSEDYDIIPEFPPHKPLTEEQANTLAIEINMMHIGYT